MTRAPVDTYRFKAKAPHVVLHDPLTNWVESFVIDSPAIELRTNVTTFSNPISPTNFPSLVSLTNQEHSPPAWASSSAAPRDRSRMSSIAEPWVAIFRAEHRQPGEFRTALCFGGRCRGAESQPEDRGRLPCLGGQCLGHRG